jgi:hypothetical protein
MPAEAFGPTWDVSVAQSVGRPRLWYDPGKVGSVDGEPIEAVAWSSGGRRE